MLGVLIKSYLTLPYLTLTVSEKMSLTDGWTDDDKRQRHDNRCAVAQSRLAKPWYGWILLVIRSVYIFVTG